jgi:hypothetical protein
MCVNRVTHDSNHFKYRPQATLRQVMESHVRSTNNVRRVTATVISAKTGGASPTHPPSLSPTNQTKAKNDTNMSTHCRAHNADCGVDSECQSEQCTRDICCRDGAAVYKFSVFGHRYCDDQGRNCCLCVCVCLCKLHEPYA